MQSVTVSDTILYFLAHNNVDVFIYNTAESGQQITTGQPVLETFTDRALFINRLISFNRDVWYVAFNNNTVEAYGLVNDTIPDNYDEVKTFFDEYTYRLELENNNIFI